MAKMPPSASQDGTRPQAETDQPTVRQIPLRDGQWMSVQDTADLCRTTPEEIMRLYSVMEEKFPAEFTCVLFDVSPSGKMSRHFNLMGVLCLDAMVHIDEYEDIIADLAAERRLSHGQRRRLGHA